jgi:hypothetical protein
MSNLIIPNAMMRTKKHIASPTNKYDMLGSGQWRFDKGLIEALNQHGPGRGDYYASEKSDKKLWDLLLYMEDEYAFVIAKYYQWDNPEFLKDFIIFCFNHVAANMSWKRKSMPQMDYFPYCWLHAHYTEHVILPVLKLREREATKPVEVEIEIRTGGANGR